MFRIHSMTILLCALLLVCSCSQRETEAPSVIRRTQSLLCLLPDGRVSVGMGRMTIYLYVRLPTSDANLDLSTLRVHTRNGTRVETQYILTPAVAETERFRSVSVSGELTDEGREKLLSLVPEPGYVAVVLDDQEVSLEAEALIDELVVSFAKADPKQPKN